MFWRKTLQTIILIGLLVGFLPAAQAQEPSNNRQVEQPVNGIIKTAPLTPLHADPYIAVNLEIPLSPHLTLQPGVGYHYKSDYGLFNTGGIESGFVLEGALRHYFNEPAMQGGYIGGRILFRQVHFQKPEGFYSFSKSNQSYQGSTGSLLGDIKGIPPGYVNDKKIIREQLLFGYQWQIDWFVIDLFGGFGLRQHFTQIIRKNHSPEGNFSGYEHNRYDKYFIDLTAGFQIGARF